MKTGRSTPEGMPEAEVDRVITWLHRRFGHDFRDYAQASFRRRAKYALDRSGCESVSELEDAVDAGIVSFDDLLHNLTVPVSEMFRDPEYFVSLRENVVPVLQTYPSIRIWVAGCSNGEEAYSMAIMLHEENLLDRTILYATDINPNAIARARKGIFPLGEMKKHTRNYQRSGGKRTFSDYYTAAYGAVLFDASLQRRITFAEHSLATDATFAEMNLISCRNVLIYFNRTLQSRALGIFQESLCRQGFLGLGKRETVEYSQSSEYFELFDRENRIFRKQLFSPTKLNSTTSHG